MIPPGLERAVGRAATRRERRGAFGDATLALDPLESDEADALDALPWPPRQRPFLAGQAPRIPLCRFEASLQEAGLRPEELYEEALDRPLRDLPGEGRRRRAERSAFWDDILADQRVAHRPALLAWLERARASGRLGPRDATMLAAALDVVERLPVRGKVDRAVLAAEVSHGRPHALDFETRLESLVRSMLAACMGIEEDARPRSVWRAAGVEVDPTSTTVLTLGLAPPGADPTAVALRAQLGRHVVLTLGALQDTALRWSATEVFVCENPSVLRAAERALGARCPPLVCAAGWPSDAVRVLLGGLGSAGARLRYHGDFDLPGIAIFRLLERELGVRRWRFDPAAYTEALSACAGRDLPRVSARGEPPAGDLEEAITRRGLAIPEELLIDSLLVDLVSAGRDVQSAG